jgi:L-malate glycosyltransferase
MKILQISSAKTFGGGEKHVVDLSKGLAKNNEVFIAVRPTCDWKTRLNFTQIIELPLKNSLDFYSAFKLSRFIRENKIEIVHAHVARDYAIASLAVRMSKNAKLFLTRHVLFPIKSAFLLKNLTKIIAVSSAVETELRKSFPNEKIAAIPNGIEIEHFANADKQRLRKEFRFEHNIPFDANLVATVGELKPLKGQEDFVIASQIVAEKFPETYFLIVGKDNSFDQKFRIKLKRLAKVFGLENRFLWLNWVEDTATLLHASDVFVSASHSESFGLAILEAMASEVCVVATATEGAKELLGEENLIPIENPTKLAEAICEILGDKAKTIERTKAAQTIATQRFNVETMISETEKLYRLS